MSPGSKEPCRVWLTTLQHSCVDCLEILVASNSWSPTALSRTLQGQRKNNEDKIRDKVRYLFSA